MSEEQVRNLRTRGWHFYKFVEPDVYRIMCSWSVSDQEIGDFVADVRCAGQSPSV
jgi:threonine aldolase